MLDLTDRVTAESAEQGLLGIALHPDFATNRRLFVYFTDLAGDVELVEYRAGMPGEPFDPASAQTLLTIREPNPYHNGGQVAFGPDGYLYIGVGDGGLLENGWRDGRDPSSLLGKILRIDVSTPGSYAIPQDNPFADDPSARPEVWALGLRNPWRFSFDPVGQGYGSATSAR